MKKNYIIKGIKNIALLIGVVLLFSWIFLWGYKDKVSINNYTLNRLSVSWIIATIIYASILILIYSYNQQYPNSKNRLLSYFKRFNKKDYFVIFSTIFSLNFLISLFTNFYSAMDIGSVYAIITSLYLAMAIFGILGTLFLSGKLIYRFAKKIKQPRIKLNKDKKDILSFLEFIYVGGSYITYNIKSKAPILIKIFNIILYSIFLILLISIIFTINKPQEIKGKVITVGELNELFCRGRGGCMRFTNYVIGIEVDNSIQTFVFTEKEFNKCDWDSVSDIAIETNPITHNAPFLNKINVCK